MIVGVTLLHPPPPPQLLSTSWALPGLDLVQVVRQATGHTAGIQKY